MRYDTERWEPITDLPEEETGSAGFLKRPDPYAEPIMRKKRSGVLFAIPISFLLILILLISACETAFYLDYDYYMKEYHKYAVQEIVPIDDDHLLGVTKYMMSYLRGDQERLSIVTELGGTEQDFFNDIEREHMADVQSIFLKCLAFRKGAVIAILVLIVLALLCRRQVFSSMPRTYLWCCLIFLLAAGGIGIWVSTDFHRGFMLFHRIFFAGDTEKTWLLDRATSNMINILPEGFFADMALRMAEFSGLFLGISVVLAFVGRIFVSLHQKVSGIV